tara:strand:+ start:271 stop:1587 length:1317 start_codon:yes stop_codon:yes gene_type:complete
MSAVHSLVDALDSRVADQLDACTRCGACVEVCPMPPLVDLPTPNPKALIAGVIEWLETGQGAEPAQRWAEICTGTGDCIEACPEGVNPRFLLTMTRRAVAKARPLRERREAGRDGFKKMSRGVQLLSRLQLPPPLLARLSPASHPESETPPEVIFYTGCNLLKSPHIGLLCLDVLERLDISYEVHGGPAMCCGILQMRGGDDENSLRQGVRTLDRFAATAPGHVLSWCPTCQLQFSETTLPVQGISAPIDMTMFPVYLASRLDALRPHLTVPVHKRVALHEHPGTPGVVDAVRTLLSAVPGIELVELPVPKVGYSLTALAAVPETQTALLTLELDEAKRANVDTLVSVYHTEHRELAVQAPGVPFEIANYMELLGAAMGLHREDTYQRLQSMRDVDAVLEATLPTLIANDVNLDDARAAVSVMLNDHVLPRPEPGASL